MARRPKKERLASIYRAVEENPGQRPGALARILGLPRSQVTRSLPTLEEHGYLLSEDERGGLWVFRRKK
jgi:DNA-binding IclR family transcriptional regulator